MHCICEKRCGSRQDALQLELPYAGVYLPKVKVKQMVNGGRQDRKLESTGAACPVGCHQRRLHFAVLRPTSHPRQSCPSQNNIAAGLGVHALVDLCLDAFLAAPAFWPPLPSLLLCCPQSIRFLQHQAPLHCTHPCFVSPQVWQVRLGAATLLAQAR